MTLELLNKIYEENNIPKDTQLLSDSGWECSATDMDGVFYSAKNKEVVITQGSEWDIAKGYDHPHCEDYILVYVDDDSIDTYVDMDKKGIFNMWVDKRNYNYSDSLRRRIDERKANDNQ